MRQQDVDDFNRKRDAIEAPELGPQSRKAGDCYDCGEPYWMDAAVPNDVWARISPTGDEGGILCLRCIDRRCAALGIKTTARIYFPGEAVQGESYEDEPGLVAAWEEMRTLLHADDHPEITWLPDLLHSRTVSEIWTCAICGEKDAPTQLRPVCRHCSEQAGYGWDPGGPGT